MSAGTGTPYVFGRHEPASVSYTHLDVYKRQVLNLDLPVEDWAKEEGIADEEMRERLHKAADEAYAARIERNGPDVMRYVEKQIVLQVLDHLWRDHLVTLDHLRQVIGWRGYAQRDPLNEYKSEAFELFDGLITRLGEIVTGQLMRVEVSFEPAPNELPAMQGSHINPLTGEDEMAIADINARIASGAFSAQEAPVRNPEDQSTWAVSYTHLDVYKRQC